MGLTKRQEEIVELLKKQGYAKVDDLSARLYISASSIRRDLHQLVTLGFVERFHGGVKLCGTERTSPPIRMRKDMARLYKRELAQKAVKLIHDGATLILDSSTTCYYLIDYLTAYKNITVFTNNLETALRGIEKGLSVYVLGGKSLRGMPVTSGIYAEEILARISVDFAFVSSYGIDRDGMVSDPSEEESKLRILMMRSAACSVLLLDSTKLGRTALHRLCSVRDVDVFLTNDDASAEEYLKRAEDAQLSE
jgi:DeoR family fructose operon transcriptional repressor